MVDSSNSFVHQPVGCEQLFKCDWLFDVSQVPDLKCYEPSESWQLPRRNHHFCYRFRFFGNRGCLQLLAAYVWSLWSPFSSLWVPLDSRRSCWLLPFLELSLLLLILFSSPYLKLLFREYGAWLQYPHQWIVLDQLLRCLAQSLNSSLASPSALWLKYHGLIILSVMCGPSYGRHFIDESM